MNENQALSEFRKVIEEKFRFGYESYLEEKGIPEKLVSVGILEKIVNEQVDLGFNEFWDFEKANIDENNLSDKVLEYIDENYDSDYIYMQFESQIDEEQIGLDLKDELVLRLINTEPYGNTPRSYWLAQANRVETLKKLSAYANGDDLDDFIMTYASDWEEVANEN